MKSFLSFLFLLLGLYAQSQIAGKWYGTLRLQGAKLPLILHIQQKGDSLVATIDSPLQNAAGIPVDFITFENNDFNFEIKNLTAMYSGKLIADSITGSFTQAGRKMPLTFFKYEKKDAVPTVKTIATPQNMKAAAARIDSLLQYLTLHNRMAGGVSVFKNGKEVYKKTFGQKNLGSAEKGKQTFQIGSITKTMTAAMIYQLEQEGKLSTADKLSEYFPQVPLADAISLAQMLGHRAGLGDYATRSDDVKWLTRPASDSQILNTIVSQGSLFQPGTNVRYSNSGYWLLARIIEKVTRKTYAQNLKARLLDPVGLKQVFAANAGSKLVFLPFTFANGWKPVTDFYFKNVIGVGDVAATPTDMNTFINALFNHKIVNAQSLDSMMPHNNIIGRGLFTVPFHNQKFYGHSGGTYGTNSLLIYNPADSVSVMYSVNASRIGINDFAIYLLNAYYNVPFAYPEFKNCQTPTLVLERLSGEYVSTAPPLELKIFIREDALYGQLKGQSDFALDCYGHNAFEYAPLGVKILFASDNNSLQLLQSGATIEFSKRKP